MTALIVWIALSAVGCSDPVPTVENAPAATPPVPVEPAPTTPPPPEPAVGEPVAAPETTPGAPAPSDERPEAALDRCEGTPEPASCIVSALGDRETLRARERHALVEALVALGQEQRALDQMELFVRDYPYDRRSNRHRLALRAAGRPY